MRALLLGVVLAGASDSGTAAVLTSSGAPARLQPLAPSGATRLVAGYSVPRKATAPVPSRPAPPAPQRAPATLGGPAKYDAKKGAMLGGTVMPPHKR